MIRNDCNARYEAELEALRQQRASGIKLVGYTCHAFPAAVIAGLGFRPVRVLCGTSAESESWGEQVVRADVCPHVKSLLGNVKMARNLHAEIDLWIGLYTCDQMRRGLDCLAEDLGKTVHPLQLPATRSKESANYYADQVRRLIADFEARYNVTFDSDKAQSWQRDYDKAAETLSRAARSGRVSPLDLHSMFHLFFIASPTGLADFFDELLSTSPAYQSNKTIVLAGSPLTREDTVLLEELETRGYAVLPLMCTGLNAVEDGGVTEHADDLIGSLALRSFAKPACMRSRPNTAVYDRIREALAATKASGLIVKSLKFCDLWYTERERLRKTFDLPVLVFDSDYAEGGRERLLSRIDAFMETME